MIISKAAHLKVITFDCYGTLIDWETGIRNAFRKALTKYGSPQIPESRMFELYENEERKIERETPYRTYHEVLALATRAVARRTGWRITEAQSRFLAKELPKWTPFPDTNPALERLATRYTLGILSNVDNDLLNGTLKHLAVPFPLIVTAEKVKSYKPEHGHFEEARRIIGNDRIWLHAASSQYHDIEPAVKLGISAAWVNRKNVRRRRRYPDKTVKEVKDLLHLAEWLDA